MDRIENFLRLLGKRDRKLLLAILIDVGRLALGKYDVQALKGYPGVFRLRKGNIRIIFTKIGGKGILIDANYRGKIYKGI